ncbi:FAD-binding protein [Mesosutterella sp. OilRF-GAM-744-9]|uniref:FAD-binding protein n=1 Tax=Mesosutterella porci TaxID=2915351 RepID=A0ABS9MNJ0_9BURK|nr:FAD-binding protein [Mesosutterella sp. oilRF-744-WT-GAM-9]MCG5030107.1 FAD-binding protein [Mesosutterella sp. oilRF-744-WT-GAM-9]
MRRPEAVDDEPQVDGHEAAERRPDEGPGKQEPGAVARPASGGSPIAIRARSIVIATGGFLNNKAMMKRCKRFWSGIQTGFSAVGDGVPPDHTGDGIVMGRRAGAAIEDMESMPKLYAGPQKGTSGVSWIMFDVDTAFLVTKAGRRITNEHESRYLGCALKLLSMHNEVGYAIFDEKTFRGPNRDRWQFDKALAGHGLFKADKDTEFGRTDPLFRAMTPPYYITAANWPLADKTEGGLEVNPDFQVLRASDDAPIPGLYAAGSTCGSISTRLCDVIASGLIVGRTASAAR